MTDLARTLEQMLVALDAAQGETEAMLERQREFVADASHELRTPLTSILTNLELLEAGLPNLGVHIKNALRFGIPVVVAVNGFKDDTPAEMEMVREYALSQGAEDSVVSTHWADGGQGAAALAEAVVAACEKPSKFEFLYPLDWSIKKKIETISKEI